MEDRFPSKLCSSSEDHSVTNASLTGNKIDLGHRAGLPRNKLTATETELCSVIYEQTGSDRNFGIIRSKGDQAPCSNCPSVLNAWLLPRT